MQKQNSWICCIWEAPAAFGTKLSGKIVIDWAKAL